MHCCSVALVFGLVGFAAAIDLSGPAVTPGFVAEINSVAGIKWTAHESPKFAGSSFNYVKSLCGTVVDPKLTFRLPEKNSSILSDASLPEEFDVRTAWPSCSSVTGHVRDQASCGSCWAFGSTEAFNDRLCIASAGKFQTLLSVEDTTACCGFLKCFSMGCNGGQPSGAWRYFTRDGIVSGGDFDDIGKGDTCQPYTIPSCAHHVVDPTRPNCTEGGGTPKCSSTCSEKSYKTAFSSDRHFAKSSYSISGEEKIMADIQAHGSVTGAFTVYADFPTYKSGVYHHVKGDALGGHAIKIMGWGVEDGTKYWLVMNSWNPTWGDHGLFKIVRGTNECGIEGQISAGEVAAPGSELSALLA